MEIGMYYNTLYVHIWRIGMQETHRNIKDKDSRLMECLKICIDSLDWIKKNSPTYGVNRDRAKATLKEIKRILDK